MRKEERRVYVYKSHALDCQNEYKVYYTVADFGDAPVLLQCRFCNEYYWYAFEEDAYLRPFHKQIENKYCEKCRVSLNSCLIPPHKNVDGGGYKFSLDDDFAGNSIPNDNEMVSLEVYLLYSE